MKTIALHNLGCKVNGYETDAMRQNLQKAGFEIVDFEQKADIYLVNTCTVTNIADRKSRQMLHRAKKMNPDAVVVAVGCYVQTGTKQVEEDPAVDLAIGNNRKKDIVEILQQFLKERESHVDYTASYVIDINRTNEYETMWIDRPGERTRAYVKIQDGCNQFCSYCMIPYARGRVRSRQETEILEEARLLAAGGCKEIVLTGIHISSYGADRGQAELLPLLEKLHETDGIERIRLGSLEPRIITETFVETIRALPKLCPHFHLSLQSGCDATLKRMNRQYDTREFAEKVELLRSGFSCPAITTDVIVGFPGETQEEFEESRAFLKKMRFYEMHIFKYSKRQGTRAAAMEGQLTEREKARRSDVLQELERQMSMDYRKGFLGKPVSVLYEESCEIDGEVCQVGHTREYVKFAKRSKEDLSNQIVREIPQTLRGNDLLIGM